MSLWNFYDQDVQLTKDHVPVIYHDWKVTETGFDIPVNALTLQQFLSLHPEDKPAHPTRRDFGEWLGHRRSQSGGTIGAPSNTHSQTQSVSKLTTLNHMHSSTHTEKGNGSSKSSNLKLKGNSAGTIQAPFATLQETLKVILIGNGRKRKEKTPYKLT